MPNRIKLTLMFALLLKSVACMADDPIGLEWLRLIKAGFPDGCVQRLDQYRSTVGYNGIRSGAWLVQTCQGNFEYGARYVPADAYSGKALFSVHRQQAVGELTTRQLKTMYGLQQ